MRKLTQSIAGGRLNRSMRARMTLSFMVALAFLLAIADASLICYSRYARHRNTEKLLQLSARELSSELEELANSSSLPQVFIRQEVREMQLRGIAFLLLDAKGRILNASALQNANSELDTKQLASILTGEDWNRRRWSWEQYTLVLALPHRHDEHDLGEFALAITGLSLLILACSSAGAWLLVGRTLAPLEALSQQALLRQERPDAFSRQAQLQSPSDDWEMTHLVLTLNGLLTRLDADTRAKARFYAAASHELRTPLQSLSGFLELGLSRERSESEYRAALEEAHMQSRNLITLVNDLLTLNQLENAAPPITGDEVDVTDVCERALQRLDTQIADKGLHLTMETRMAEVICAPWSHMEMLLRNLLENAIKYAMIEGRVQVRCEKGSFEVFNECAPISGWDEEKIFEPFFRPDVSRNSQTGGNGLGLAISKAICDANQWQLKLHQIENGVTAQVIFYPAENR